MLRALYFIIPFIILLGFFPGGCTPKEKEIPAAKPNTEVVTTPAKPTMAVKPSREGWEAEWDKVLQAAKGEGKVSIYTNWGADVRPALQSKFFQRFGINIEFMAVGKGPELTTKLETERRAGLFLADIIGTGATTLLIEMKPAGMLAPIDPMLILPEIKNPNVWLNKQIPYLDEDKTVIGMVSGYTRYLTRNTDLVKEGEIKSYHDLLDPKWKGKIVINDPSLTGTGNSWMSLMVRLWGLDKTMDYLRQLIKQEPMLTRDLRAQAEWIARGKYPIGIAAYGDNVSQFKGAGAPIDFIDTIEGGTISTASGCLGRPSKQLPQPKAATIFVNWLLSKEGQTEMSKNIHRPSARVDVETKGLEDFVPGPGQRFLLEDEQEILEKGKLLELAKTVFAPLMK